MNSRQTPRLLMLWALPLLFLALFYFFPLSQILSLGFSWEGGSLGTAFERVFTSPSIRRVLGFTFWQALLSTLLTLLVGLPGAYLFGRFRFRGKPLFRALISLPFVMPTLVVAAAFNAFLGPRGIINLGLMEIFDLSAPPIEFMYTFGAILAAHVFYNTSIVVRLVGDFWSRLDPRLGQAARSLGASRWQTWWQITFPLLAPVTLAAALLIFIFDFSSFGVVLILGGPHFATLEVEIYYQAISLFNLPVAAALSVLQLGTTLALTLLYTRLNKRVSRPLDQQSRAQAQQPLRGRGQKALAGILLISYLIYFVLPLAALGARSFTRLEPERGQRETQTGLTLDFYQALDVQERESFFIVPPTTAIRNSLAFAGVTVLLALSLGFPAAWALARFEQHAISRFLDPILMLPLGTSAVTLGFGYLIALNRPPLDLRTSVFMVPLAHTLVAFPFVVRSLTPALRSIQPQLRQAAQVLGAKPWQVFRYIDLPLTGQAILVSATFAFTISLGEFGATALISRPEYPTIPVMIYRFLSQPGAQNYGQALALSTILMVVTGLGMILIENLRMGDSAEF